MPAHREVLDSEEIEYPLGLAVSPGRDEDLVSPLPETFDDRPQYDRVSGRRTVEPDPQLSSGQGMMPCPRTPWNEGSTEFGVERVGLGEGPGPACQGITLGIEVARQGPGDYRADLTHVVGLHPPGGQGRCADTEA